VLKNLLALFIISAISLNENYCKEVQSKPLRFKDIWEKVKLWHPQIKLNQYFAEASNGAVLQAGLKPNPEIELEMEEFGGKGSKSGFDDATILLGYSKEIERGGKRHKRTAVAIAEMGLQDISNSQATNELFYEVREIYLDAVFSERKVQLENELFQMAKEYEKVMNTMITYGKASPLGLERARIEVALVNTDLNEAKVNLKKDRNALVAYFGENIDGGEVRLDGGEIEIFLEEQELVSDFQKSLIKLSLAKSLELQEAILALENANAKSNFDIGVGLQKFMSNEETAFLLRFSVPLKKNDRNQGNILAQKARIQIEKESNRKTLLELQVKLYGLKQELNSLREKLNQFENTIVPTANRLYKRMLQAQKAGKVNYLEVLEARRTLVENRRAMLATKRELCKKINEFQQTLLIPRQELNQ